MIGPWCEKQLLRAPLLLLECNTNPFMPTATALATYALRQNMHKAQIRCKKTLTAQATAKGKENGSICLSFWL